MMGRNQDYHYSSLTCAAPDALPGSTVRVTLAGMGMTQMMGGDAPMGARMMLRASPTNVPAGTVSLVAENLGWRTHEVVLLALPDGARDGPVDTIYEDVLSRRAWLDFLVVDRARGRHGIGRALVHKFLGGALADGCTHVGLTLADGSDLPGRVSFFEACGMTDLAKSGARREHMGGLVSELYSRTSP
jgi:hypothetical protein